MRQKRRNKVTHIENNSALKLYELQYYHSDYLDELQRAAQRYYFLAIAGYITIYVTLFNNNYITNLKYPLMNSNTTVNAIIDIGWYGLLLFGVVTLFQLSRLRAMNITADKRIRDLEDIISKDCGVYEVFKNRNNDSEKYAVDSFGYDWGKALLVSIANSIIAYIIAYNINIISINSIFFFYITIESHLIIYKIFLITSSQINLDIKEIFAKIFTNTLICFIIPIKSIILNIRSLHDNYPNRYIRKSDINAKC